MFLHFQCSATQCIGLQKEYWNTFFLVPFHRKCSAAALAGGSFFVSSLSHSKTKPLCLTGQVGTFLDELER